MLRVWYMQEGVTAYVCLASKGLLFYEKFNFAPTVLLKLKTIHHHSFLFLFKDSDVLAIAKKVAKPFNRYG